MACTKLAAVICRATAVDIRSMGKVLPARCPSPAPYKRRASVEKAPVDDERVPPPTAAQVGRSKNAENVRSRPRGFEIDFDNTEEAYKSKTNGELLRSLLVFKLCSLDFLVDRNRELMDLGQKVLGRRLFERLMKMTFYGQFVAGEDHDSIKALVHKNRAFGVGAVLDYGAEEDLTRRDEDKETDSCVSGAEKKEQQPNAAGHHEEKQQHEARAYIHSDEAKCDEHLETFLKCIGISAGSSADGFSAIKMTALGRPQLLLQFSEVLVKWRRLFDLLAARQGQSGGTVLERKLEREQLKKSLADLGIVERETDNIVDVWFARGGETIDLLDWNGVIDDPKTMSSLRQQRLAIPNARSSSGANDSGQLEPLLERFGAEEEMELQRVLQRAELLAQRAADSGVRLMVDAEQSYFQPAIGRLTLAVQRGFNRDRATVYNTYQCYLKEALDSVRLDAELSRRQGWHFGAKLVRGAYMDQERARALHLGHEDPVNPSYEATDGMYRRCLDLVLEEVIARDPRAGVMVASHNEDTVRFALERMGQLGLLPQSQTSSQGQQQQVSFGQLLGMCDQVSFPLGQAGLPAYKYVPYGPVAEVLPYLSRRAQENRGLLKGSRRERHLLWKELKRRLLSGQLVHNPVY